MPGVDGERGKVMERGSGELVFHGYGVSFWEDENVLEADRGDGSTTLNVENDMNCLLYND